MKDVIYCGMGMTELFILSLMVSQHCTMFKYYCILLVLIRPMQGC